MSQQAVVEKSADEKEQIAKMKSYLNEQFTNTLTLFFNNAGPQIKTPFENLLEQGRLGELKEQFDEYHKQYKAIRDAVLDVCAKKEYLSNEDVETAKNGTSDEIIEIARKLFDNKKESVLTEADAEEILKEAFGENYDKKPKNPLNLSAENLPMYKKYFTNGNRLVLFVEMKIESFDETTKEEIKEEKRA